MVHVCSIVASRIGAAGYKVIQVCHPTPYLWHMTIKVWLLAILASSLEVMGLERLDH